MVVVLVKIRPCLTASGCFLEGPKEAGNLLLVGGEVSAKLHKDTDPPVCFVTVWRFRLSNTFLLQVFLDYFRFCKSWSPRWAAYAAHPDAQLHYVHLKFQLFY